MARGITEKMSHFRNTLFMSKPSLGAPESFRVIKKTFSFPVCCWRHRWSNGWRWLVHRLDWCSRWSRLSLQNSANGTESSNSDVSSTLNANDNQLQSSSLNIKSIIRGAEKWELSDPVEVLKYLPKQIVTGRPLEVTSSEDTIEGETNYLTVDRDNILATIFAELQ